MERLNNSTHATLLTGLKNPKKFIITYNELVLELEKVEHAFTVNVDELLQISIEEGCLSFKFTHKCMEQEYCLQLAILTALSNNNLLAA
jgi:hypothetical protein